MPAGAAHYPDPGIQHGAFRVLPRTDGTWFVMDDRRPPGEGLVMVFKTKAQAAKAAKAWFEQGHGEMP